MRVKEWMTPSPLTVGSHATVFDARRLMDHYRVRCLPVVEESGRLIGLLTDLDVVIPSCPPTVPRGALDWDLMAGRYRSVQTVMRRRLVAVDPDDELAAAAQVMLAERVGVLPVARGGVVVGVLTASDCLRGLLEVVARRRSSARAVEVDPDAYKPVPAMPVD